MTWNKAAKQLKKCDPHLDKDDLEKERQDLLKMAGSKPDSNGRYSVKTLTNSGLSTFLDLCETTISGEPNQKRRSRSVKHVLKNLEMPGIEHRDAYLNSIAEDKFGKPSWESLELKQLTHLLYTVKARLRAKRKPLINQQKHSF